MERPLATFLKDFGPALLAKYRPRAIVVFSAHWDTAGERLGYSICNRSLAFFADPLGMY